MSKKDFLTSPGERAAYAAYPFGLNVISMLCLSFLTIFFTDEVGLSTGAVATLFLVARVWDAVNDPLFGGLVDRVSFRKGKFKHWVSAGIPALPLAVVLLFLNPAGTAAGKLIYASITYILLGMLQTVNGVPHSALATTMSNLPGERNTLLSLGMFAGMAGAVLTGILGGPLINKIGYTPTTLILAALAFLTMLPLHFMVKERVSYPQGEKATLKSMWNAVVKNKYLLALNCAFIFLLGTSFALSIGTYFVKWNLGNLELLALIMIGNFLPIALIPLFLPLLIRLFGKRRLTIWGLLVAIILSVVQYFVGYDILPLFLFINGVKIIGIYLPVLMMNMFLADCAEYGASVTGSRNAALNFAIGAFTNKLGGAISASLSVLLLGLFGYDGLAAEQTQAALDGIWLVLSLLPSAGMAVMLLIFAVFYRLEESDVAKLLGDAREVEKQNP